MFIIASKSKCMSIHFSNYSLSSILGLQNFTNLKILGVIFSNRLTWHDHFSDVCKKASRRLYVLRISNIYMYVSMFTQINFGNVGMKV